jgi:hypothetical protein
MNAKELAMIPYEIDPSLHDSEPPPPLLEDGFSPPHPAAHDEPADAHLEAPAPPEFAIGEKSPF